MYKRLYCNQNIDYYLIKLTSTFGKETTNQNGNNR
jgi:hypothetical protein